MKNLSKKIVTGIMTLAVCSMATVSAFADTTAIDENDTHLLAAENYLHKLVEIVPAYTVSISIP